MASVPTASVEVIQTAVSDDSGTAVQPEIAVPFEVKLTVPFAAGGPAGLTVAVMVTASPNMEGLGELVTDVVVLPGLTTCGTVLEVLPASVPRTLIDRRQTVGPCAQACIDQNRHAGTVQRGRSNVNAVALELHRPGRKGVVLCSHGGGHGNRLPQGRWIRSTHQHSRGGNQRRWRQTKDRAVVVAAARVGRPIKVSVISLHQPGVREFSVTAAEGVQGG